MTTGLVHKDDIARVWGKVERYIVEACEYNGGRISANDYLHELTLGSNQLWLSFDDNNICGVTITKICDFPNKKVCSIEICTGNNLANWWKDTVIIEEWAKNLGCEQMFLHARTGFSKLLKELNYKQTHIVLEKDL